MSADAPKTRPGYWDVLACRWVGVEPAHVVPPAYETVPDAGTVPAPRASASASDTVTVTVAVTVTVEPPPVASPPR